MAFLVCRSVGCPHPDQLPLTLGQLLEWQDHYERGPWTLFPEKGWEQADAELEKLKKQHGIKNG